MNKKFLVTVLSVTLGLSAMVGCATKNKTTITRRVSESVVMVGGEPAALAHLPLPNTPLRARNAYLPTAASVDFIAGRDFSVDYASGTLRRTPGSRIPDFQTNILFGQDDFDHTKFPGYGNSRFLVFVDYSYDSTNQWPRQESQIEYLKSTQAKLAAGDPVKIVAFGDSITAGGEATRPELVFWRRWSDELRRDYPNAHVTAVNGATGGDTTRQGLQRLQSKVISEKPDLVLIGFGMNDNNKNSVPVAEFEKNLSAMVARIRAAGSADIILHSAFPPNPKWRFGSAHMAEYAAATEGAARATGCAYADVFDNWQAIAARKKPEDMLGNNINHPNDFGHWIYYRVLGQLGLNPVVDNR